MVGGAYGAAGIGIEILLPDPADWDTAVQRAGSLFGLTLAQTLNAANVGRLVEEADADELYERAVKVVQRDKKCSTSYIQRRLQIGYNRAASLIERMEQEGVVGPANHAGKRAILAGPPPMV